MPTYSPNQGDPDVIRAAYAEARKQTDNPVIILALFATGLVESGLHNLSGGNADSEGFLQQRPSQGWKNPTNVQAATDSFIAKAQRVLAKNPNMTAGQLAQAVQVSAYPGRYTQALPAAQSIVTRASGGKITSATTNGNTGTPGSSSGGSSASSIVGGIIAAGAAAAGDPGAAGGAAAAGAAGKLDPITAIAAAISAGLAPLKDVGKVADLLFKASVPTTLIRIVCGIAALWFLFFGVVLLSREMRTK